MKKSEMLEAISNSCNTWASSPFICLNLKEGIYSDLDFDYNEVHQLTEWIEKSISDCRWSTSYGVGGWLFDKGFISTDQMYNQHCDDLKEYRQLWIKDMIAYWQSKGE